jgi:hypothetical protein
MNHNRNDFCDEDINMLVSSYEMNINQGSPLLDSKIPVYIEFLKTKKYYRTNNMDEDYFFNKRFNISDHDINMIKELINRIKSGKNLHHSMNYNVDGNYFNCGNNNLGGSLVNYSNFDENEDLSNKNKFELLSQVEEAMNDYYARMKKLKNRKINSSVNNYGNERSFNVPANSVADVPDRYYNNGLNSERPDIQYDVLGFAKSKLMNTRLTGNDSVASKLDKINNIIDYNQESAEFDTEFKKSIPNINSRKKVTFNNNTFIKNNLSGQQLYDNEEEEIRENSNNGRFWQDQDILKTNLTTRNPCIKNKQPFENQFQYLDSNYNRVLDPRLMGESSRQDNRSYFR